MLFRLRRSTELRVRFRRSAASQVRCLHEFMQTEYALALATVPLSSLIVTQRPATVTAFAELFVASRATRSASSAVGSDPH
jgi:hypothetical protein